MRTTMNLAVATLLAILTSEASAFDGPAIKGNGVAKQETREVAAFHSMDITAPVEVTLSIGPKASVVLNMDENILPIARTEVVDGVLSVSYAPVSSLQTNSPQKVKIVVPTLEFLAARGTARVSAKLGGVKSLRVSVEGASKVQLQELAAESIEVKAEGVGQVTLSGRGNSLDLDFAGSSKFLGGDATFQSARLSANGTCRLEVQVTDSIAGNLDGACKLKVKGNPKGRKVVTSGVAKVTY